MDNCTTCNAVNTCSHRQCHLIKYALLQQEKKRLLRKEKMGSNVKSEYSVSLCASLKKRGWTMVGSCFKKLKNYCLSERTNP